MPPVVHFEKINGGTNWGSLSCFVSEQLRTLLSCDYTWRKNVRAKFYDGHSCYFQPCTLDLIAFASLLQCTVKAHLMVN